MYSQVCDVIHDGPAFDRVALSVDEVVVDLKGTDESQQDEAGKVQSSVTGGAPARRVT